MIAIEAKNIHYAYDQKPVLQGVDLSINSGFTSIIGPNGCGKTTLLKIVSGLIESKQDIYFYGNKIQAMTAKERAKTFAIVNQKQQFPFPFTCMEFVALGRYPHRNRLDKVSEKDLTIVIDSMKKTHVLPFKDKLINELSGGEQQRVVLACMLAQQPKILFLDEAFSALDISHKAKMIKLLKELTDSGNLIVVSVMHDLNIAYRYSNQVVLMEKGEVVKVGEPTDVMTENNISTVFDVEIERIENKGFYINV